MSESPNQLLRTLRAVERGRLSAVEPRGVTAYPVADPVKKRTEGKTKGKKKPEEIPNPVEHIYKSVGGTL